MKKTQIITLSCAILIALVLYFYFNGESKIINGTVIEYFDADKKRKSSEEVYKEGNLIKRILYYDNGLISDEMIFGDHDNTIKIYEDVPTEHTMYYMSGSIKMKQKGDSVNWYYENGALESEAIIINDKNVITKTEYYIDGGLRHILENGKEVRYFESGAVESIKYLNEEGLLNGESIGYLENGQMKYKWNFKNGMEDGEQLWYFSDDCIDCDDQDYWGEVFSRTHYKNDTILDRTVYYANGEISIQYFYKNGELTDSIDYDIYGKEIPKNAMFNRIIERTLGE